MKFVSIISVLLFLMISTLFGTDKIQTITVTTPVFHTWDEGEVKFAKIPYTGWDIDNLFYSSEYYSRPYFVLEAKKHLKQDINLISVYKLRVQSNYRDGATTIYISTANAKKPKTHRFSIEEVVKFSMKAVRSDFPDKEKHLIKVTKKTIPEIFKGLSKG